jgi:hypothetical protein
VGRSHFLSCYWTVEVNTDCDFLLFIIAQPPDTILHSSQTQVGNDSVPWTSVTIPEVGKLGCIQWKFVTLCHRFFGHLDHSWGNVLNYLKLHTLSAQRHYLDVLFSKNFFSGSKYCPTCLEAVGLYMPNCNDKDFSSFYIDLNVKTVLLLNVLWREIPVTVILIYAVDIRSWLIWLASIWYYYYTIS